MPYENQATAATPALILFLIDVSASMSQPMGTKRRIDVVTDALYFSFRRLAFLSGKGMKIAPRYRIGIFAYSDQVHTLLQGIETIDQIALKGVPTLPLMRTTDTARAFEYIEGLLDKEMPGLRSCDGCPAPLVCHLTDGEYTGADPEPIVRRIMNMVTPDGNVLVENIFVAEDILPQAVTDPKQWLGILPGTALSSDYARKLRNMSSPLPETYRAVMRESNYQIARGASMMLPGASSELVEMGFVMATSTPVSQAY